MRAWYLPMCVSSARPLTSPIAYSQSDPDARIQSSTSIGLPGSSPIVSTPSSVVLGRRPIATSNSSPGTDSPESSSTTTSPPSDRTAVALPPLRTSTPRSRRASSTSSAANGSSFASRRSAASISVICDPRLRQACAISTPTTPPPRIVRRSGTCLAVVASRLVQGLALARPSIGGMMGPLPVATTTACVPTSVSSPTTTRRSPSKRPAPRTIVTPRSVSQGSMCSSSRLWMISSRRSSTAAASSSPVTASATPGMRRTSASSSPGRSSAFDGMQA